MDVALPEDPGEPSFFILRIQAVKADSRRNIGSILILVFHTFFHIGKMNQIQHIAPINCVLCLNGIGSIFNGFFYKLHLLNFIFYKLQLNIQGIEHKVIIGIVDGHFPYIVKGKTKVFQEKNLLKPGKVFICIKTRSCFCHKGRFQNILLVIISYRAQGNMRHSGKLAGGIITVFFHIKLRF